MSIVGRMAGCGELGREGLAAGSWSMGMWLYDDVREMEDFQAYQIEVRGLEREYLEIRILLREAETALRTDPDNGYLQAKVKYLHKRQLDLEKRGPRLAADHPLEIALWAPPHG